MFDKLKSMFKEDKKESGKVGKINPAKDNKNRIDMNRPNQTKREKRKSKKEKSEEKTTKGKIKTDEPEKGRKEGPEKLKETANEGTEREERNWPNKVKAIVIVELMGTPLEHIKNTMQLYLERIKENDNMEVEHEELAPIEKKDSFFLQFAELTITFKSVKNLIEFCFDYMPSSIEIIEPDRITYNSQDLSDIVNDLQAKLHQLDMIVKNLRAENKVLNDNGNLLLRNLILVSLKDEMSLDELVKVTGINKEAVEKFIENLADAKLIEKKNGKYRSKASRK